MADCRTLLPEGSLEYPRSLRIWNGRWEYLSCVDALGVCEGREFANWVGAPGFHREAVRPCSIEKARILTTTRNYYVRGREASLRGHTQLGTMCRRDVILQAANLLWKRL